jgi:hypothetical protein
VSGRSLRNILVAATFASVASAGLATAAAAATSPVPGPVASERHRHGHHHGHHHDDCDPERVDASRAAGRHDDDCGPPPTVPEVPLNLLLPLSGAAVVGAVVVVRRRGRTTVRSG